MMIWDLHTHFSGVPGNTPDDRVAHRANNAELDPIIKRATELKAPIFQHTWLKVAGNDPGESTPMELAALAARHPEASIICGHSGGDWERGLRVIRPYKNVCTDL